MDKKKLIIILGSLAAVLALGVTVLVFLLRSGDKESGTETKKQRKLLLLKRKRKITQETKLTL
ncbi:hypothetical protein M153_3520001564 [Pseudoloma neurophilia]|uniref:Uncharacterized protein n=1 Tax=Pseudoloma neurophilia TaxID=146866 RepID=A0A0R0LXX8_9MICR|nr:hypothetical protein M153_3520001564 [Pseudoloma neurophilia]